ncbi:MAG: recombination protein RecR [SAR202 cluster bacterium]|nr:recombination protein RecR [SAR202 cluster bacterium]|tara:strand:+ start:1083 stop:1670 length:588 start_codon:yes stop_codon:yes gene_type:complete
MNYIDNLINELSRFQGIGAKTAQRLAYHLIRMPKEDAKSIAQAIIEVKDNIKFCSLCFNITAIDPCIICTAPDRDRQSLCVVEQPLDVLAFEKTAVFKGMYHVLHGAISPINGVGPQDIKLNELIKRVEVGSFDEIILATNVNLDGEATAMYVHQMLSNFGVKITRPARGLPFGGDLEYADQTTLSKAFEGRQNL